MPQILTHFLIADDAGVYEAVQSLLKDVAVIGDIEPHDVDVLCLVFCGKFNARNHLGGGQSLFLQG